MDFSKTPYSVLGVHRSSSLVEVKAKYRELASAMHPDRHDNSAASNAAFADVTAAYATLSSEKKKYEYDTGMDLLTEKCRLCFGAGYVVERPTYSVKVPVICSGCKGCGRLQRKSSSRKRNI